MKNKRITSMLLSLAIIVSTLFCFDIAIVKAATSGSCGATGSSVTWVYDEDTTTLTLSGSGSTKDYGTTSLNRPGWYDYKSVITTVVVEEGITTIGCLNFYQFTALTSVSLPSTLTTIKGGTLGYGAFAECTALTSIELPSNLTTIGAMAFKGCTALTSITFPDSLTSLGEYAFQDCSSLTSVTYGTGLTSTGVGAFYDAGVKNITFSSTITAVDSWSFYGCKMTSVELPETITSIGTRAFANCTFISSATIYNANCTFEGIVGEDPFNGSNQSLTIYGHSSSTAQTYAEEKGYDFVSIDSCDHETTYEVVTLEPTCTEEGTTTQVCENCGFVVSETTLAALGHTWTVVETVDNTETDGHIYTSSVCDTCGETLDEITHVSYVEGYYEYTNTATCTRAGIETYTCLVDGCGSVTRSVASKGNHQVDEYTVTAEPTCTTDGSQEGVCTVCGETVTETIAATGHTNEYVESLDNTAEDGHTYDIYLCSVCGEQTITATHAEWLDDYYTSTVVTEPGCVISGLQRDTCSICGETRYVTIAATGQHDWVVTTSTDATCTARGTTYYACSNCSMTKVEYTEALGHDYVLQEDSSVDPTCTTAGYNVYKCSRCSAANNVVVSATGHTADPLNYTINSEATCTEEGSATSVCTVCGESFDIVLTALGHNYENVITEIEDMPGHSLSTPTCTRCGYTDSAETVHDEWIEGDYTTTVITEGSCTVARVTRDTCSYCSLTRTNTTAATGHQYVFDGVLDDGTLSYTCSVCSNNITRTPTTLLVLWNSSYINTAPEDTTYGYLFETVPDGIINAKDYSIISKANKAYTVTTSN
ncbi:MAG: leucine-rich repeat domain-containing protein [Clostridiales bacterium]|nr:leucine-rich repeat domain-containing protein [Clostridiales bacterium]